MSQEFLSLSNPYVREFLSSAASSISSKKTISKASKATASYKYPYFIESASIVDDDFWKRLLQDAAKGKFMSNFFFDGVSLTYRRKNHTELTADLGPEDRAYTFISFHQRFGVQSPRDIRTNASNQIAFQPASEADIIKSLRKSVPRRLEMIRKYVNTQFAHLTDDIRNEMITQISVFFDLKLLKPTDICISDGEIVNIMGITANEEGVIACKDFPAVKQTRSRDSRSNKVKPCEHLENWLKFLKTYTEDIDREVLTKETISRIKIAFSTSGGSGVMGSGVGDEASAYMDGEDADNDDISFCSV
jgi:hypothetical protein